MSRERWKSDCRSQCQITREACRLHYLSKHHLNSMWDKLLHFSFRKYSSLVEFFFFTFLQHACVYISFLTLLWFKTLDEWNNICIKKPGHLPAARLGWRDSSTCYWWSSLNVCGSAGPSPKKDRMPPPRWPTKSEEDHKVWVRCKLMDSQRKVPGPATFWQHKVALGTSASYLWGHSNSSHWLVKNWS